MRQLWLNKRVILVVFVVIEIILIVVLYRNLQQREKVYQQNYLSEIDIVYESILTNYEKVARVVFDQAINQPEVLNIVDQAYYATPESQGLLRDQLFTLLSPLYQRLLSDNFKQLHFHFPDDTSFLRFHRPDKFGDDLSDVRGSVTQTNQDLRPVFGFEEGRIYNGFRYVFPLFYEGRHIGSVEISFSFSALEMELRKVIPQDYAFIVKKELIEENVFAEEQNNYQDSDIDPNYAYELAVKDNKRIIGKGVLPEETIQKINQALPTEFHTLMNQGDSGTMTVNVEGKTYLVGFLAIKNIQGEQAAYLISYRSDETIPGYWNDFLVNVTGMTILLFFILMLVTLKQQNIQTMQVNQKRLLAISEQMLEGLLVLDESYQIQFINQSGCSMLGVEAENVVGKLIGDFIDEVFEMEAQDYVDLKTSLKSKQKSDGTIEILLKTTQKVSMFEHVIRPLILEQANGYLLVFRDVTDRWQTELFLVKAKEEAEAGARAKSQFLAAMSHEIRTPMNAVIGMTSLLSETQLTGEQQEYVETIRLGGESLLAVINDILDFSKLDSDHMELDIHVFSLRSCIEDAVELTFNRAAQKGLELISLVDSNLPRLVEGDATRIRQILVNLISNAIKFTDQGEVFVSVKPARDGVVLFEVRDTGIGIAYERTERLFKPFSQVDASTTRRYGGTGLGLAICKRLVDIMQGRIWVNSMPGEGSIFSFEIPLKPAQIPETETLGGVENSLIGKHILIVDDLASNQRVLSLMLRNWGMTSESFSDPLEVLQRLNRGQYFDLLILDYQMPGMDGVMLAKAIREIDFARNIPMILLSSAGATDEISLVHKELFVHILNKPLRQSRLYDVLANEFANYPKKIPGRGKQPQTRLDENLSQVLPLRILVAEDNQVNQHLALLVLQKMGYRADAVGNGLEVLEALERQPYDIVFMDVQMPVLDGIEATHKIIQQWPDAGQRPRIIAMTANAMPADQKECLMAGMDDYLSKPIRLEQVQMMLEKWGGNHTPRSAVKQSGTKTLDWHSILDQEIINDLHEMGVEAFAALRELFISEGEETLLLLTRVVADLNLEEIRRIAHSLKGSAMNLGAGDLSEAAKNLEVAAKEGRADAFEALLEQVKLEFERTAAALNNL